MISQCPLLLTLTKKQRAVPRICDQTGRERRLAFSLVRLAAVLQAGRC